MTDTHERILSETERIKALGETAPRLARDPVSQPIINAWLDAMEETDPRFTQGLAPPAMAQVWTMPGLRGTRGAADPLSQAMEMLDAAGYTSVLGTNCDQTYERYLRVGEQVSVTTRLEDVAGPKQTGVGCDAGAESGGYSHGHPCAKVSAPRPITCGVPIGILLPGARRR